MVNDLVHWSPLLNHTVYAIYWSLFLLVGAVVGIPCLLCLYLPYKIVTDVLRCINNTIRMSINKSSIGDSDDIATLAVVITGCDSGFGYDLAVKLLGECAPSTTRHANHRYKIFALCLRDDSCGKLVSLGKASNNPYGNTIDAIQCDVTSDESVTAAIKSVEPWLFSSSKNYLHGLVNNAGIGTPGFVDMLNTGSYRSSPYTYRNDMEVNLFGMIRSTQACLPLFKDQATRSSDDRYKSAIIINVTSMAGLVASPNMSAYTCSKHAAEAFSSSLKYELADFNIAVSTCNPSFHATPLVANIGENVTRLYNTLAKERPELYEEYGFDYIDETRKTSIRGSQAAEWKAYNVTQALMRRLHSHESGQELVGLDAKFIITALRHLPVAVQDAMLKVAFWRWHKPKAMMQ
jgi:NAD(P)-dependent dehydrogenase (short-subunit alcohol dehydrogenase family)